MNIDPRLADQAILELWPEFPHLFRDSWAAVKPQIEAHLEALADKESPAVKALATKLLIKDVFAPHPTPRRRLSEALESLRQEERTKTANPRIYPEYKGVSEADLAQAVSRRLAGRVDRYLDIAAPQRLTLGSRGFLVVALRHKSWGAEVREKLSLELRYDVEIELASSSDCVDVEGPAQRRISLLEEEDSAPIAFFLQARRLGSSELLLEVYQDGNWLRSVRCNLEVVAEVVPLVLGEQSFDWWRGSSTPPADLLIRVRERRVGEEVYFDFSLRSSYLQFPEVPGEGPTFRRSLGSISQQWSELSESQLASLSSKQEWINRGRELFTHLFPDEIRAFLWKNRKTLGTVLLVSDEPYIPWEAVFLHDEEGKDRHGEGFFCEVFRLTRWLAQGQGLLETLGVERAAMVGDVEIGEAPEVAAAGMFDDAGAAKERPQVDWVRLPVEETDEILLHLQKEYDCWYIEPPSRRLRAIRGEEEVAPSQGTVKLSPSDLAPEFRRGLRGRRPLFFLNSDRSTAQRWDLTDLVGWPKRLLVDCHCGLLIGPQWSVSSSSGSRFAEIFFETLRADREVTLGELVKAVRSKLRADRPDDFGWLAYTVYGHPNCRIHWPSSARMKRQRDQARFEDSPISTSKGGTLEEEPSLALRLEIDEKLVHGEQRFLCRLGSESGSRIGSLSGEQLGPPFRGELESFGSELREILEDFVRGFAVQDGERVPQLSEDIDRRIESLGQDLFRQLLPKGVRRTLNRNKDRLASLDLLRVGSEIPWELVRLQDPDSDEDGGFLALRCGLTRWLREVDRPPVSLPMRRIVYVKVQDRRSVSATDPRREERGYADIEGEALARLAKRWGVEILVVTNPRVNDLEQLLQDSGYGLVHISSHGLFDIASPQASKLMLEDGSFSAGDVQRVLQHAFRRERPLIFLNACQVGAGGWGLTQFSGWATSCLESGCSAFIAPLWSVPSKPAAHFAARFYDALGEGVSLGDAALAARKSTFALPRHRLAWLAYAVYGRAQASPSSESFA